jgi:uncharacterized membrane protein (DUF4010 family)
MEQLPGAWIAMAEALLIGLLVGIEREGERKERRAGLRDFISIGLAGGICGVLNQPWLTVGALAALTAMIVVFRVQSPARTGITTEIVAVVTFLLCVLTATPGIPYGSDLAIALTVVLALFLEAREPLRKFFVETVTEREYFDTLRFLAVIFVILPILPNQDYGPYAFFNPYRTWVFVILVSSISFLGYFLQKFLGSEQGLFLTAILGGIGSTTAATLSFAKQAGEQKERSRQLAAAAVLANAVLSPRLIAILAVVGGPILAHSAPMLIGMTLAGLVYTFYLSRGAKSEEAASGTVSLSNPFRLGPALKFGFLFALIRLVVRFASTEFGSGGSLGASAIGGFVDVDAIVFSLPGLVRDAKLSIPVAVASILVAVSANAVLKTGLAYYNGGREFGRVVLSGFILTLLVGGALLLLPV